MSTPGPRGVETAFWLTLCGALTGGIGIETDWGRRLALPPPPQTAAADTASGDFTPPTLAAPYRLPAIDTMLETSLRPLFVSTRRPAPPPLPPEPPKPTMNKGQFKLSGVSILPEGKFAFLVDKSGKQTHVVAQGKEINGILVKEVSPDSVVLSQHGDSELLVLQTAKGPARIPLPATTPAVQAEPKAPPPPPQSVPPRAAAPAPAANPSRVTVGGGTVGPN